MHIPVETALNALKNKEQRFAELFKHKDVCVEIYKPLSKDHQQPHDRDEIYFIIDGEGEFILGDRRMKFYAGDFLFVPAGVSHRFENFTDDFATWVIFFGSMKT